MREDFWYDGYSGGLNLNHRLPTPFQAACVCKEETFEAIVEDAVKRLTGEAVSESR